MLRHNHHLPDISAGPRYYRRDVPKIVWQAYAAYEGRDGLPHVMLFNVSDPTSRKTLSEFTLEHSGLYKHSA